MFETGIGSGALSMTMLRWGATIVGYEIREDFANRARANVREFLGEEVLDRYDVHSPTATRASTPRSGRSTGSCSTCPSRGRSFPTPRRCCSPGGVLVAYTPSIMQAAQVARGAEGRWIDARTLEVLHRGWHIDGQAVRPDHRMVAHTAFLTVARFLGAGNRAMRADPKVERVR